MKAPAAPVPTPAPDAPPPPPAEPPPSPPAPDTDSSPTTPADLCPNDPAKTAPGVCGCGIADGDTDKDGTPDCQDQCPSDAKKIVPGGCGCGKPDTDTDKDGMPDCFDQCPADPAKSKPGVCGCGTPDADTDADGKKDCVDNCPLAANPDQLNTDGDGQGNACDPDDDGDAIPDGMDNCPLTANPKQEDQDKDGTGDACDSFTADIAPPIVVGTTPPSGSAQIPRTTAFTVSFNEAITSGSVTGQTVSLKQGAKLVAGAVTYQSAGFAVTFTPATPLAYLTTYTLTLTTGIKDVSKNALAKAYTCSFTTMKDVTPPAVLATTPAANAGQVSVASTITVQFSKPMNAATLMQDGTFTLKQLDGQPIGGKAIVDSAATTLAFTPYKALAYSATYKAVLTTAAQGGNGTPLAKPVAWTFTTEPPPPLAVLTIIPSIGAKTAGPGSMVAAIFNKDLHAPSIGSLSFKVMKEGQTTPVPGQYAVFGNVATFKPSEKLSPNTAYLIALTQGIQAASGEALAAPVQHAFLTAGADDTIAPRITFVSPMHETVDFPLSSSLVFVFTEEMDPATAAEIQVLKNTAPLAGTMSYWGHAFRFQPEAPLTAGVSYTVTISAKARDLSGNPVEKALQWKFTAGASDDTKAPAVKIVAPTNLATNIPLNRSCFAEFTKVMDPLSVNAQNILVEENGAPLPGIIGYAGRTIVFRPLTLWKPSTVYTLRIRKEATDLSGNAVGIEKTIGFTTGAATDTWPLGAAGTIYPQQEVDASMPIVIERPFNAIADPLAAGTAHYFISKMIPKLDGTKIAKPIPGIVVHSVPDKVSIGKSLLQFYPLAPLEPGTEYQVTVSQKIASLSGNPLNGPLNWTFKTKMDADAALNPENFDPPPTALLSPEHQKLRAFVQWMRDKQYPENVVSKWVMDYMNPVFHKLIRDGLNFGSKLPVPLTIRFVDLIPTDAGAKGSPIDIAETEAIFKNTFGVTVQLAYQQYPVHYVNAFGPFLKDSSCWDPAFEDTTYACYRYVDGDANMYPWIKDHWTEIVAAAPALPTTHSVVRAAIGTFNGLPVRPNLSVAPAGIAAIDADLPSTIAPFQTFRASAHEWAHTFGRGHNYTVDWIPFGTWGILSTTCGPVKKDPGLPVMLNPFEAYMLEPAGGFPFSEMILGAAYWEKLQKYPACEIPLSAEPDPRVTLSHAVDTATNTIALHLTNTGDLPLALVPVTVDLSACGAASIAYQFPWLGLAEEAEDSVTATVPLKNCAAKITVTLGTKNIVED
ncbi:MAG: Ig-like domain-containing protein [Deltaproteobacteria bacterium]|nr:Ig-like domain-containing protein [Deltaproteobacteria bacterium]